MQNIIRFFCSLVFLAALNLSCGAVEESKTATECLEQTQDLCPPGTAPDVNANAADSCEGDASLEILTESGEISGACRSQGSCSVVCRVTQDCLCGIAEITREKVTCQTCNTTQDCRTSSEGCDDGFVCAQDGDVWTCTPETCEPGEHTTDTTNCGCNGPCASDEVCSEGVCSCAPENLANAANCGCNGPCEEGEECSNGVCSCNPDAHTNDREDCGCNGPCRENEACIDGACLCAPENLVNPANCGCNGPCNGDEVCNNGVCSCGPENFNNPANCGCNGPCDGDEICNEGVCSCDPENLTNAANCGCNGPCEEGEECSNGVCSCNPDAHTNDRDNCGCNGPCASDEVCSESVCACNPRNLTNPDNCGCNGPCASDETCEGGTCTCAPENLTNSDNCGCNGPCDGDETCEGGACTCAPENLTNPDNCGCDGPCENGEECSNGTCSCDPDAHTNDRDDCGCNGPCGVLENCAEGSCQAISPPLGFALIAPATFDMGSPTEELGRSGNEAQHTVTLTRPFFIQTHEVTQGEWNQLMGTRPSTASSCGDSCPVETISWLDAVQYANRKSQLENLTPCYDEATGEVVGGLGGDVYACAGYRLPTEAEWELAARAGTTTAFPSGPITEDQCSPRDPNAHIIAWYCSNANGTPHPVGSKDPNAWGLYDMHGNVWEWTHDLYIAAYETLPTTDPANHSAGQGRTFRGGAYGDPARNVRSAKRASGTEDSTHNNVGLRLARSAR